MTDVEKRILINQMILLDGLAIIAGKVSRPDEIDAEKHFNKLFESAIDAIHDTVDMIDTYDYEQGEMEYVRTDK